MKPRETCQHSQPCTKPLASPPIPETKLLSHAPSHLLVQAEGLAQLRARGTHNSYSPISKPLYSFLSTGMNCQLKLLPSWESPERHAGDEARRHGGSWNGAAPSSEVTAPPGAFSWLGKPLQKTHVQTANHRILQDWSHRTKHGAAQGELLGNREQSNCARLWVCTATEQAATRRENKPFHTLTSGSARLLQAGRPAPLPPRW